MVDQKSLIGRLQVHTHIDEEETDKGSTLLRLVKNPGFDSIFALVIAINSLMIGVQADYMAREMTEDVPPFYVVMDKMFCIIFVGELLVRFFAFGQRFFAEVGCMWGMFDFIVVGLQVTEETLRLVMPLNAGSGDKSTGTSNMSFMRTLRILRLIRVLRIVRIVRFMDELRTLVVSIMNSMRSLFWTLVLLVLGIYVVGIYFTQVVMEHRLNSPVSVTGELDDQFGGLLQSMMSLFQAMSGGIDWNDLSRPLIDISPFQGVVIAFYIAFTVLALTNVVTGVFVEGALKSAEQEEEAVMLDTLRRMFWGHDRGSQQSGGQMLSREKFEERLQDPTTCMYLKSINVDVAEADMLFSLIDEADTGQISYDEFVRGCMRIRGSARAIDSILLLHELVETRRDLETYRYWAEEQMSHIAIAVGGEIIPLDDYFAKKEEEEELQAEEDGEDDVTSGQTSLE